MLTLISWKFALFVLLTLLGYYLIPRRVQNAWLLIASLVFLGYGSLSFVIVLVLVSLFNFLIAQKIASTLNQTSMPATNPPVVAVFRPSFKLWVCLGVGVNLLVILTFRLVDRVSFLSQINAIIAASDPAIAGAFRILQPIGLSFYGLQAISYLIDVSHKRLIPCQNPIDFTLYLAYFPKILAGPIERARNFLPQLSQKREVNDRMIAESAALITLGLVRKLVIADMLISLFPADLFNEKVALLYPSSGILAYFNLYVPQGISLPLRVIAIFGYVFYIYNDFAGYTNIARGVSLLFGIRLSANFQQPCLARDFSDFWNRWHISLSSWLRDYIYFPLNRLLLKRSHGKPTLVNIVIPPVVTMVASGLWHGLTAPMILWGLLNALFQIIQRVLFLRFPKIPRAAQSHGGGVLAVLITLSLWALSIVAFAAPSLEQAFACWNTLLGGFGGLALPLTFFAILVLIGLSYLLDSLEQTRHAELWLVDVSARQRALFIAASVFFILLSLLWNAQAPDRVFIYQGF